MNAFFRGIIGVGLVVTGVMGVHSFGRAAEDSLSVEAVVKSPATHHRHIVTLKGVLRLIGRAEGKDVLGQPLCGPVFVLKDDTGEIPVLYMIRCQAEEVQKVGAMAGYHVRVTATIEVPNEARVILDDPDHSIRAIASSIQKAE